MTFTGGVYQIDVTYRGQRFYKLDPNPNNCLTAYWDFVIKVNDKCRFGPKDWAQLPTPYGAHLK
jgi:hypothetical protein